MHESGLAAPRQLALRFTGSGSEYFRIWIVNLLLTLLTVGFYYPFAKVRRLRYFHANTLVGEHALGFHADPWKMLRGYVLVGVLFLLYGVAGQFSEIGGLIAFLIVAAIWPALLKSSLQFRMANTSWRGLRFRFKGSTADAYRALLPLFVPAFFLVAPLVLVADRSKPPMWYAGLTGVVMLAALACAPWLWWKLKKYQHDHYAFGPLCTTLEAGCGSFYGVFFKTAGVTLLAFGVVGAVAGLLVGAGLFTGFQGQPANESSGGMVAVFVLGFVLLIFGMLLVQALPGPYFTSRMQNLLWSNTSGPSLQFASALRFRPLFWLTLKNWLLVMITLGFYWPFAAVASARMRLEAVSLRLDLDPQQLVETSRGAEGEAAGDAAGDLFGIDIGL